IPDPADRAEIMPDYFRLHVEHAMTEGAVWTDTTVTAAAVWLFVGAGWNEELDHYGQRLAAATGPYLDRFRTFDKLLAEHHPAGRYDHLAMLAVHPDRQREGIGGALLGVWHEFVDRAEHRTPCYLEASDTNTRAIYLNRGYVDHAAPIHLPDGPLMFPMR